MNDFTYETETHKASLETYEWDNVWWEYANTIGTPRVLYIGDSISCGIRKKATEIAEHKILFDGFGTSKALDNPYFIDSVRLFAKQQRNRVAVLLNNGLHGWHLEDENAYGQYYERMINFLLAEFKEIPIFLVLTTHVKDKARDARVIVRNRTVEKLAKKYGLPKIDFYTITKEHDDMFIDGVHFHNEMYELMAKELVKNIQKIIEI